MRTDLGAFFTIMTAGLIALFPFGTFPRRLPVVAGAILTVPSATQNL